MAPAGLAGLTVLSPSETEDLEDRLEQKRGWFEPVVLEVHEVDPP